MSIIELVLLAFAFLAGFAAAYLLHRARIAVIEGKARNELERWKIEYSDGIRRDSVNRSRSTLKGRIAEQMAPFLPEFPFAPADARFIGNPVDFIVFDGYTRAKDDAAGTIGIVLVEVKSGRARLTRGEALARAAVEEGRVSWKTVVLDGEDLAAPGGS